MVQRLFVGVDLSDELRSGLAQALAALHGANKPPAQVRVLSAESWHVTLQFLGAVADERVEAVTRACADAATQHSAFVLELGRAGAFPATRAARVVWAGFGRGEAELAALATSVGSALAPLGFAPDQRV